MQTKTCQCLLLISIFSLIYSFRPPPPHLRLLGQRRGHPFPPRGPPPPPRERFKQFHKHFKRPYRFGSHEYLRRYEAFQENIKRIEALNKLRKHNDSAQYGVTKFSDMTAAEFKVKYLSGLVVGNRTHLLGQMRTPNLGGPKMETAKVSHNALNKMSQSSGLPSKWDWRTKGFVSPVRNQKGCGGCWAFSVVETIESVAAIKTQTLVPLSVQELIDCSNSYEGVLWGCKGGDTGRALKWLQQTKTKLVPAADYPLTDKAESCQHPNTGKSGVAVTDYSCTDLVPQEEKIQQYISRVGPVSVSVDATTWHNYLGGIIQYHCGENPNNHAVVIVGYDRTGEIPYYIVKNSWGDDFGDKGYMYIAMGDNVCGIAKEVSTVAIAT